METRRRTVVALTTVALVALAAGVVLLVASGRMADPILAAEIRDGLRGTTDAVALQSTASALRLFGFVCLGLCPLLLLGRWVAKG